MYKKNKIIVKFSSKTSAFILSFYFIFYFTMSSIITDLYKKNEYESIFRHYDIDRQSQYTYRENEKNDNKNLFETIRRVLERNENKKKKKVNAKTIAKKSKKTTGKNSPTKSKQSKKPDTKVCFFQRLTKI